MTSAPDLLRHFQTVRAWSHQLVQELEAEDLVVQSMPDASPLKWHLAHTSWFFETFVLKAHWAGYCSAFPHHEFLFNSYYNAVGPQFSRPHRGVISRPTVAQTLDYRRAIDRAMETLICDSDDQRLTEMAPLVVLGCHHEQQHQELMLTDLKHAFAQNPLHPAYRPQKTEPPTQFEAFWREFSGAFLLAR